MRELLQNFVEEAFGLKDLTPDDALIRVIMKNKDTINEEMIKRMVEMFNVMSFKKKQEEGADLEESFPIATTTIIIKKINEAPREEIFENEDPLIFKGIDNLEKEDLAINLNDVCTPIEIVDVPQKQASWVDNEIQYKIKNAAEACSNYIVNLKKANDENLYKELRYLFPNSKILKLAGIDKGAKKIPERITADHKEFDKINDFFFKIAKDDKQKDIIPPLLDKQDMRGFVPLIPINNEYGMQFYKDKDNKGKSVIRGNLIDITGVNQTDLDGKKELYGGYYTIPNTKFNDLKAKHRVIPINSAQQGLDIALAGGYDKYIEKKVDANKPVEPTLQEKQKDETDVINAQLNLNKAKKEQFLEKIKDFTTGFNTITDPAIKSIKYVGSELGHLQEKLHNLKDYWIDQKSEVTPGTLSGVLTRETKDFLQRVLDLPARQTAYMNENNDKLIGFLRRKNIFESLLENDPNLQGADPHQMLRYYRDLTQIAPTATLQPEITRSLLNAANAIGSSAIDPATALNLAKLEDKLRAVNSPYVRREKDEDDY